MDRNKGSTKRSGLIWSVLYVLCVLQPLMLLPFIHVLRCHFHSIGLGTRALISEETSFELPLELMLESMQQLCFEYFMSSCFLISPCYFLTSPCKQMFVGQRLVYLF